jgi:hypothetical protein
MLLEALCAHLVVAAEPVNPRAHPPQELLLHRSTQVRPIYFARREEFWQLAQRWCLRLFSPILCLHCLTVGE